ncbi:MAG: energy transducer TonB, partial [Gammaproteobacteria bacterium]|nr:energy transducer TonB [Gammaproteobacteria bacterium]
GDDRVIVSFDVDENGFVVNTMVVESSSKALLNTAIKIVSNRRYSPRIADGEPVISRGLTLRYSLNSTIR